MSLFKRPQDEIPLKEVGMLSSAFDYVNIRQKRFRQILVAVNGVLLIIAIVFIAMYFNYKTQSENRLQKAYNEQIKEIVFVVDEMQKDDLNVESNYLRIVGCLGRANEEITLLREKDEQYMWIINEMYTASIKLPKQFVQYLPEIKNSFELLLDGKDDEAYLHLKATVEKFDKLDF